MACKCKDYTDYGFCNCNDKPITTDSCETNDPNCESCDG